MPISVIIPAKNEAAGISQLISYLKTAAFDSSTIQIVVVDGLSTDSTVLEAQKAGATVIKSTRAGRAYQMNLGASHAKNSILFFLHADTFPPKHWDLMILNALKSSSQAGCFRLRFHLNHSLLNAYAWFTRFDVRFVRYGDQGLFVNASYFNKSGGFRNELIVMEDNEIVYALKKITPFTILPHEVITSARKYQDNGIVRLQLIFGLIYFCHRIGISQPVLVDIYRKLIKQ